MPRKNRFIVAHHFYHIISRGNNRSDLFFDENDFRYYYALLLKYSIKFNVPVFHYCLMTNHVHLLVRCSETRDSIGKMMHGIQTCYARYNQKKHRRTGHIFENRFKDFLIDTEAYLLECGRYIERNPVRAQMVINPNDYSWSSCAYYALGRKNNLIQKNPRYQDLGRTDHERQTRYYAYIMQSRPYEKIVDSFFQGETPHKPEFQPCTLGTVPREEDYAAVERAW